MATEDLCLTELILCIQHEVQSAVDYIAAQAAEPSELGASSAVMAVETLRVRLPFDTEVLRTRAKAPPAAPATPAALADSGALRTALAQRKGLALDIGKPGGLATYLKLKVRPVPASAAGVDAGVATARAEIEISFAPLQRPG
jgi:hypothetical protein